jgi:hypothetical protein
MTLQEIGREPSIARRRVVAGACAPFFTACVSIGSASGRVTSPGGGLGSQAGWHPVAYWNIT